MKRSALLTALTLLLGLQSIRVLIPSLVLYLYAALHVNIWIIVVMGYGTFALAFMAPLLVKWFTPRGAFWVAGLGLMLCRVAEQISTSPALDAGLAIGGTVCFLWLLPLLFGQAKAEGDLHSAKLWGTGDGVQAFALGFLLGLSLDTLIRGLTGTLDLSWIPGVWPILTMIALVSLFGYLLWETARDEVTLSDESSWRSLVLIGPGLLLFFQALIFQNQGWVTELTGWSSNAALSWIMLGNVGALFATSYAFRNSWLRSTRWWSLVPGSVLTLALIFAAVPGWTFALSELIGLVSSGFLLAVILGNVREPSTCSGIGRVSFGLGLGLLLAYLLITLYYLSLLVSVPIPRAALAPAAGIGLMLCAMVAAGQPPLERTPQTSYRTLMYVGALLMLLPLSQLIIPIILAALPQPVPDLGGPPPDFTPVRVMTYNIHGGYGLNGRQDVEAIAQVIERAQVDVVVLQEIERGWLLEGGTDLLAWLSNRLEMPYTVMGSVTDPIAGNAILSRAEIIASGKGDLPNLDTLVARGYVWAEIYVGPAGPLRVIVTHLHHEPERSDVRVAQVAALLQAWGKQPYTVLAGDLNAIKGSPEIQMIREIGFVDSWMEAGYGDRAPIDWIFHTPDLIARQVRTINSPASDHPAVVATIELKEKP